MNTIATSKLNDKGLGITEKGKKQDRWYYNTVPLSLLNLTLKYQGISKSIIVLSVSPLVSFLFRSFLIPCNYY